MLGGRRERNGDAALELSVPEKMVPKGSDVFARQVDIAKVAHVWLIYLVKMVSFDSKLLVYQRVKFVFEMFEETQRTK